MHNTLPVSDSCGNPHDPQVAYSNSWLIDPPAVSEMSPDTIGGDAFREYIPEVVHGRPGLGHSYPLCLRGISDFLVTTDTSKRLGKVGKNFRGFDEG